MDKNTLLREYFGHTDFRPGQQTLINALLDGRDAFGVMPTGAGKSMCYQIPAMLLPGITLVVSPLISLMKDQVMSLCQMGIPAAYLNSSLTYGQYCEALRRAGNGAYKIIYVAPERLFTPGFRSFACQSEISMVAVDEAHCVSQWGQDFRPGYLQIARFVAELPKRPVVAAFTATATREVRADILQLLQLREPTAVITGFDRENLRFSVERPSNKLEYLLDFLKNRPDRSGIVYCSTRKYVEKVCQTLQDRGIAATRYHAGLDEAERRANQEDFSFDRRPIMVATNAFGMGIDKSNVSFVIHYNMPKDLESYYQEAGRAGRDGSPGECVLLFSYGDIATARFLVDHGETPALPPEQLARLRQSQLQRLNDMIGYCYSTECLRAQILRYFGESCADTCENCGNCQDALQIIDVSDHAETALRAVISTENRYNRSFGTAVYTKLLYGLKDDVISAWRMHETDWFGALSRLTQRQLQDLLEQMKLQGLLKEEEDGTYRVLTVGPAAGEILDYGQPIRIRQKLLKEPSAAARITDPADKDLLTVLRRVRRQLSRQNNVPDYLIFSVATLEDMARKRPVNQAQLLQVSGVGTTKAHRYGADFLEAIRLWSDGT